MTRETPYSVPPSRAAAIALVAFTLVSSWAVCSTAANPPPATRQAGSRHITLERATELALREVPGGRVESVEHDSWRGRAVYEVDLVDADGWEVEIVIDAENGQVLDRRTDD